jgi:hypothetical protein
VSEFQAPGVRLLASAADADRPKWIQIAYEGSWKGHHQGAFKLSRGDFDRIVDNFRAHPAYVPGGGADVVPFDFDHASEMPSTVPSVASVGKPAQGWARELEVRVGKDGQAQLWALSRVLEPAKSYLRESKIKWVSAAICFASTDFVTGKPCGPALTSIAFTNQPFLRALPAIAASARPQPGVSPMARSVHLLAALNLAIDATDEQVDQAVLTLSKRNADLERENGELRTRHAEEDVDQAIRTYGLSAQAKLIRPTLLSQRLTDPKGFAAQFPRLDPAVDADVLTTRVTTPGPAAQTHARVAAPSSPALRRLMGAQEQPAAQQDASFVRTLASHPGRNKTERAMSYVRSIAANKDLSHEDCHAQACMLLTRNGVPAHVVDITELLDG